MDIPQREFSPEPEIYTSCPYKHYHTSESSDVIYDPQRNLYGVMSYKLANETLRNPNLSNDLSVAEDGTPSYMLLATLGESSLNILFMDPPRHTELRKIIIDRFTSRNVQDYSPWIQHEVNLLIAGIADNNNIVDISKELAEPLSVKVIGRILGIPEHDQPLFKELTDLDAKGFDPNLDKSERKQILLAQNLLREYLNKLVITKSKDTSSDLISDMINTQSKDSSITNLDILNMCQLVLRAGNLSTADLINNSIYQLLLNEDQKKEYQENPNLIDSFIEEVLRYDSPVLEAGRITINPTNISEYQVPQGQTLMVSLASANHDPAVFENAEGFDIKRINSNKHLSFGAGRHYCLGAPLAKLEAKLTVSSFFKAFPDSHISPLVHSKRRNLPSFMGFENLYINLR